MRDKLVYRRASGKGADARRRINYAVFKSGGVASCASAARKLGLSVDMDLRNEKISYKVREHSLAKVPVLLIAGKKEAAERLVSIRRLGSQEQASAKLDEALAALAHEATPPDLKTA